MMKPESQVHCLLKSIKDFNQVFNFPFAKLLAKQVIATSSGLFVIFIFWLENNFLVESCHFQNQEKT